MGSALCLGEVLEGGGSEERSKKEFLEQAVTHWPGRSSWTGSNAEPPAGGPCWGELLSQTLAQGGQTVRVSSVGGMASDRRHRGLVLRGCLLLAALCLVVHIYLQLGRWARPSRIPPSGRADPNGLPARALSRAEPTHRRTPLPWRPTVHPASGKGKGTGSTAAASSYCPLAVPRRKVSADQGRWPANRPITEGGWGAQQELVPKTSQINSRG